MSDQEDFWEIDFDSELIICSKCRCEYLVDWKEANDDSGICPYCELEKKRITKGD